MNNCTKFGHLLMQISNKLGEVCESYKVNRQIEIKLIRLKATEILVFTNKKGKKMIQRNTQWRYI